MEYWKNSEILVFDTKSVNSRYFMYLGNNFTITKLKVMFLKVQFKLFITSNSITTSNSLGGGGYHSFFGRVYGDSFK